MADELEQLLTEDELEEKLSNDTQQVSEKNVSAKSSFDYNLTNQQQVESSIEKLEQQASAASGKSISEIQFEAARNAKSPDGKSTNIFKQSLITLSLPQQMVDIALLAPTGGLSEIKEDQELSHGPVGSAIHGEHFYTGGEVIASLFGDATYTGPIVGLPGFMFDVMADPTNLLFTIPSKIARTTEASRAITSSKYLMDSEQEFYKTMTSNTINPATIDSSLQTMYFDLYESSVLNNNNLDSKAVKDFYQGVGKYYRVPEKDFEVITKKLEKEYIHNQTDVLTEYKKDKRRLGKLKTNDISEYNKQIESFDKKLRDAKQEDYKAFNAARKEEITKLLHVSLEDFEKELQKSFGSLDRYLDAYTSSKGFKKSPINIDYINNLDRSVQTKQVLLKQANYLKLVDKEQLQKFLEFFGYSNFDNLNNEYLSELRDYRLAKAKLNNVALSSIKKGNENIDRALNAKRSLNMRNIQRDLNILQMEQHDIDTIFFDYEQELKNARNNIIITIDGNNEVQEKINSLLENKTWEKLSTFDKEELINIFAFDLVTNGAPQLAVKDILTNIGLAASSPSSKYFLKEIKPIVVEFNDAQYKKFIENISQLTVGGEKFINDPSEFLLFEKIFPKIDITEVLGQIDENEIENIDAYTKHRWDILEKQSDTQSGIYHTDINAIDDLKVNEDAINFFEKLKNLKLLEKENLSYKTYGELINLTSSYKPTKQFTGSSVKNRPILQIPKTLNTKSFHNLESKQQVGKIFEYYHQAFNRGVEKQFKNGLINKVERKHLLDIPMLDVLKTTNHSMIKLGLEEEAVDILPQKKQTINIFENRDDVLGKKLAEEELAIIDAIYKKGLSSKSRFFKKTLSPIIYDQIPDEITNLRQLVNKKTGPYIQQLYDEGVSSTFGSFGEFNKLSNEEKFDKLGLKLKPVDFEEFPENHVFTDLKEFLTYEYNLASLDSTEYDRFDIFKDEIDYGGLKEIYTQNTTSPLFDLVFNVPEVLNKSKTTLENVLATSANKNVLLNISNLGLDNIEGTIFLPTEIFADESHLPWEFKSVPEAIRNDRIILGTEKIDDKMSKVVRTINEDKYGRVKFLTDMINREGQLYAISDDATKIIKSGRFKGLPKYIPEKVYPAVLSYNFDFPLNDIISGGKIDKLMEYSDVSKWKYLAEIPKQIRLRDLSNLYSLTEEEGKLFTRYSKYLSSDFNRYWRKIIKETGEETNFYTVSSKVKQLYFILDNLEKTFGEDFIDKIVEIQKQIVTTKDIDTVFKNLNRNLTPKTINISSYKQKAIKKPRIDEDNLQLIKTINNYYFEKQKPLFEVFNPNPISTTTREKFSAIPGMNSYIDKFKRIENSRREILNNRAFNASLLTDNPYGLAQEYLTRQLKSNVSPKFKKMSSLNSIIPSAYNPGKIGRYSNLTPQDRFHRRMFTRPSTFSYMYENNPINSSLKQSRSPVMKMINAEYGRILNENKIWLTENDILDAINTSGKYDKLIELSSQEYGYELQKILKHNVKLENPDEIIHSLEFASGFGNARLSYLNALQKIDPRNNIFTKRQGYHKVPNIYVPKELNNIMKGGTESINNALLSTFDVMTTLFKNVALLSPGFPIKTFTGDSLLMYMNGLSPLAINDIYTRGTHLVTKMKTLSEKIEILRGEYLANNLSDNLFFELYLQNNLNGDEKKLLTLMRRVQSEKVFDTSMLNAELQQMGKRFGYIPNYFASKAREVTNISRIGLYDKLLNDNAFYQNLLRTTHSSSPREVISKILFDQFDLTNFERDIMMRVIPFYTFFSKTIRSFVDQILRGNIAGLSRILLFAPRFNQNMGIDYGTLSPYQKQSGNLFIPLPNDNYLELKIGNPTQVIEELIGEGRGVNARLNALTTGLAQNLNPLIKTFIEGATESTVVTNQDTTTSESFVNNFLKTFYKGTSLHTIFEATSEGEFSWYEMFPSLAREVDPNKAVLQYLYRYKQYLEDILEEYDNNQTYHQSFGY